MNRVFHIKTVFLISILMGLIQCKAEDTSPDDGEDPIVVPFEDTVRFASYNVSMFRSEEGDLVRELADPLNAQVQRVAAVIQQVRPDVLTIMEMDYDEAGEALKLFRENFLEVSQNGGDTLHYPYSYVVESNTGVLSGVDIDENGQIAVPGDAFGFGNFEGQYASALLSKYPIDLENIRTFRMFLWKDIPGAKLPEKSDGSSYYSTEALDVFRISSKNHADIPIVLPNDEVIHALISHPTPPVFDGSEDRNGLRNHDEIRLWADYISNENYLVDDNGTRGGLAPDAHFVIMGDLNADPLDGDSADEAILQLLNHNSINPDVTFGDKIPASEGGKENNKNSADRGEPDNDTSFFGLRIDYVLPSNTFDVIDSGVFWPHSSDPQNILVANGAASDHLCVWTDVKLK